MTVHSEDEDMYQHQYLECTHGGYFPATDSNIICGECSEQISITKR